MAAKKQNRPVFTARSGRLSVTVWLNEGQKGDYYQVAPQRAYNGDGELKNSASFAESDVPLLARLFDETYVWMRTHPPDNESAES